MDDQEATRTRLEVITTIMGAYKPLRQIIDNLVDLTTSMSTLDFNSKDEASVGMERAAEIMCGCEDISSIATQVSVVLSKSWDETPKVDQEPTGSRQEQGCAMHKTGVLTRQVPYTLQKRAEARGGAHQVLMSGVELEADEDYGRVGDAFPAITIYPVTSKKKVSYNCWIQVPMDDVPALIQSLKDLHAEWLENEKAGQ